MLSNTSKLRQSTNVHREVEQWNYGHQIGLHVSSEFIPCRLTYIGIFDVHLLLIYIFLRKNYNLFLLNIIEFLTSLI